MRDEAHLNPALGLRAIRWSLADPAMFLHAAARHPARRARTARSTC